MANRERQVRPPYRPQYGAPAPRSRTNTPPRVAIELPTNMPWRWIALGAGLILSLILLRQAFLIREVKVGQGIESEQIPNTVRGVMSEDWRQGSTLTLNPEKMEGELLAAKPQLKSVQVKREGLQAIAVTGTLKRPALGWSSGGQNFLLDRDGTAIGPLLESNRVPVIFDGSNLPVKVGTRVASPRFVAFASEVPAGVSAAGLKLKGLRVQETTYDLWAETTAGYRIVFDTDRTVADQIEDLKVVLATLKGQGRSPAEYIDLRVAGKAYFR